MEKTNERCLRRMHDWVRARVNQDIGQLRRNLKRGKVFVRARRAPGTPREPAWENRGATERGSHA